MTKVHLSKIIWAVDVLTSKEKVQLVPVQMLRTLTSGLNVEIEPVCILRGEEARIPSEVFKKESQNLRLPAEKQLRAWTKKARLPGLAEPTLLVAKTFSQRDSIETLLTHAKNEKADLIVLTTHARDGAYRFLLGSFAESLLLQSSQVPILILNPKAKIQKKFSRVFFPTDLSDGSHKIFRKALPLVSLLKASLILYHHLESYSERTGLNLKPTTFYSAVRREAVRTRREKLGPWAEEALKQNIACSIIVDSRGDSAADGILRHTRAKDSTLIALAAQSGKFSTVLVGSNVRKVVRGANCPVWVLHA